MVEHPISVAIAAALAAATISGAAVCYARAQKIAEIYETVPAYTEVEDLYDYIMESDINEDI